MSSSLFSKQFKTSPNLVLFLSGTVTAWRFSVKLNLFQPFDFKEPRQLNMISPRAENKKP